MIEWRPDGVLFVRSFLAVTVTILGFFVGKAVNRHVRLLREYNVPEPVTGGLLFAAAFGLLNTATGLRVTFDLSARDVLLVYFFTAVGINARLADLKSGGWPLAALAGCVTALVLLQNVLGMGLASLLGVSPAIGLIAGSVSLAGGHGTAIAWAPVFADRYGIDNALEIGVLCATAGLLFASLAGGPVAHVLLGRCRHERRHGDVPDVGIYYGEPEPTIDYVEFLRAILAIHVSAAVGIVVHERLAGAGVTVPLFLPAMLAGLLLTSVLPGLAPRLRWPTRTPALALIAEVSLGVILGLSLMTMQIWSLAGLAGPLLVLLGAQVALAVLFTALVVFRVLGRNYDAAVASAGFIGFTLGAVATAMANMTAVTQRHGPSHVAFVIVPLVAALFATLLNAAVIRAFISM
jgi:ESS family glutamate:Na+ symporter